MNGRKAKLKREKEKSLKCRAYWEWKMLSFWGKLKWRNYDNFEKDFIKKNKEYAGL